MKLSNIPFPDLAEPNNGLHLGFISQYFAEHPEDYAGFGLQGHDGLDLACTDKNLRPHVSAIEEGEVVRARYDVGSDKGGYGQYVRIYTPVEKSIYAALFPEDLPVGTAYLDRVYGHFGTLISDGSPDDILDGILVKLGDYVHRGQAIGIEGQTGNATGPHTHVGLRFLNANKQILNSNNGFFGYIDNRKDLFLFMSNVKLVELEGTLEKGFYIPCTTEEALISYGKNFGKEVPSIDDHHVDWPNLKIEGTVKLK